MYCHKCGARMPEGSAYCAKCGIKLITVGKEVAGVRQDSNTQLNPKQIYFRKLAVALAKDSFVIDPRLLDKSDYGKTIESFMHVPEEVASKVLGPVIGSMALGPLTGLISHVMKPLAVSTVMSGEDLYAKLEPIASNFNFIAAKYDSTGPVVLGVIDSDGVDIPKVQGITNDLCRVFAKGKKRGQDMFVNCLYVFLNEKRCAERCAGILAKGRKRAVISTWEGKYVYVWPIVVNVPAEKLEYKQTFQDTIEGATHRLQIAGGLWVVKPSLLYETLVT